MMNDALRKTLLVILRLKTEKLLSSKRKNRIKVKFIILYNDSYEEKRDALRSLVRARQIPKQSLCGGGGVYVYFSNLYTHFVNVYYNCNIY